jgi:hypothetical protein
MTQDSRVTLVSDLEALIREYEPEPCWLVSPRLPGCAGPRLETIATLVALDSLDLTSVNAFQAD